MGCGSWPTSPSTGYALRADERAAYASATRSESAYAAGGGQYFESPGEVVAVDRQSGQVTRLATGLDDPGVPAVGPTALCVPVHGKKMEFSRTAASC
jgi:hypothetical protein